MPRKSDEFRSPLPPLQDYKPPRQPTLAPPWVALLSAWLGLLMVVASIVFVALPASRNPRAELTHQTEYSPADKFLPVPIYGIAASLFVAIVVLWQMRKEPPPPAEA